MGAHTLFDRQEPVSGREDFDTRRPVEHHFACDRDDDPARPWILESRALQFSSQGLALSKDSLYNYLGYLEESFVVFTLPVAERSLRKQAMNPKKLHAIDWALAYSFVAEPSIDVGKKLETAVLLHWRRQREDLGYLAGDREADLVVNRVLTLGRGDLAVGSLHGQGIARLVQAPSPRKAKHSGERVGVRGQPAVGHSPSFLGNDEHVDARR